MKLLKAMCFLVLLATSASLALADGIDPIVSPGRSHTGSPQLLPVVSLDVPNSNLVTDDFTVEGGVVTAVSITLPAVDVALGVTCGPSNAFLDGGTFNIRTGGFAPVFNTDGTATCSYTSFTGTPPNEPSESVSRMELDCTLTNLGALHDADDCAGVPSGTTDSDVRFSIFGGVPDADLTANSVITPEPASACLLMFGLTGLGAIRRRRAS
jgi:hypothetical protein